MKYVYLIKFDFSELFRRKINESEKKFYFSTISALAPGEELLWIDEQERGLEDLFYTIPVFHSSDPDTSFILVEKFIDWATRSAKIILANELLENSFYICIDITGIKRDNQYGQLFNLLSDLIHKAEHRGDIKFYIFLDTLPFEGDILYEILKTEIDEELVYLIDLDGRFLPQKRIDSFSINRFYENRKLILPNYRILLKNKIIRKHGHYKVNKKDNLCHRYFYDASFCLVEIKNLVNDIIETSARKEFEYILCFTKYSPWLIQCMEYLAIDLKTSSSEVYQKFKGAFKIDDILKSINTNYENGDILIVTDLINTGSSFQTIIQDLFQEIPSLKAEKLMLLSIMNAKGKSTSDFKRIITINNKEFHIPYFVDVEIKVDETGPKCDMCRLKLPFNDIDHEQFLKLSSFNFWELSDDATYHKEFYGTIAEKFMPVNVKMNNWFKINSAFIIYKYLNSLESININPKIGTIFIYPDERYKEEILDEGLDTPSYRLAISLRNFFNAKEVGIPRYIIDKFKKIDAEINELDYLKEEWIEILRANSENYTYVIIDEFHRDGETFESLMRVLQKLNRIPKCFFPVIDYNTKKTKEYKKKYQEMHFLNLYEFNYK